MSKYLNNQNVAHRQTHRLLGIVLLAILCAFTPALTSAGNAPSQQQTRDYPCAEISNGVVEAVVALPDQERGYYRGQRFEHAGMVLSLKYAGHEFLTENNKGKRTPEGSVTEEGLHDGGGTAEEFWGACGYDKTKPGAPFVKIGHGIFESDRHRYGFWKIHKPVRMFEWETDIEADHVVFSQSANTEDGWGYEYTKTVALTPGKPELVISHELKNTGTKHISNRQYSHNFMLIDGHVPGPDYQLRFGYAPTVNIPEGKYKKMIAPYWNIDGKTIRFKPAIAGKQVQALLKGYQSEADSWLELQYKPSGASITISVSEAPAQQTLCVLPESNGICIENFIGINLAPGQTKTWSRTYRLCDSEK